MVTPDATHLHRAVTETVTTLAPHTDTDWHVPAGTLDWTCWTTAAHIAHDLLAYAGQLTGRPDTGYLPFDLHVHDTATPTQLLRTITACGGLLHAALTTTTPDTRAWHWGPCDPTGFAAMGVAETLLHTHDITQGLHIPWQPPTDLCTGVLDRLFPDAPPGDPVQVLLWSTGRGPLDGRPPRTSWTWQAAVT